MKPLTVEEEIGRYLEKTSEEAKQTYKLLQNFVSSCNKDPCDVVVCKKLLAQLKQAIAKFESRKPHPSKLDYAELLISRHTLENAAFLYVKIRDFDAFGRHITQLFAFYQDFPELSKETGNRTLIIGLYLLHLLASNRNGDFYMILELISAEDFNHEFVQFVVKLEEHMMNGNFQKIYEAQSLSPTPLYSIFMQTLLVTARLRVAECMEVSYKTLSLDRAKSYLMIQHDEELGHFLASQNERNQEPEGTGILWKKTGTNSIAFESQTGGPENTIPTIELLQNAIGINSSP